MKSTVRKNKTVKLPPETWDPRNQKVRISIWIDGDVMGAYRAAAEKRKMGYQTLMNETLREAMPGLEKTLADRVAELERAVSRLEKK